VIGVELELGDTIGAATSSLGCEIKGKEAVSLMNRI